MQSRPRLLSERFGPRRPCVVVNPGGGAAAPRVSWLQPSGENNFPCAARIPRGTNSFRLPALHCVSTASGAASPSPAGRITTRTRWARTLFNRKEIIMANIGTFTADKDGFAGQFRRRSTSRPSSSSTTRATRRTLPTSASRHPAMTWARAGRRPARPGGLTCPAPSTILRSQRRSTPA